MMRNSFYAHQITGLLRISFVSILLLTLFAGCHKERNRAATEHLKLLDSLLTEQPQAVLDSLDRMDMKRTSAFNRGYYSLLQTIALDKNYHNFDSDSLINTALKQLTRYRRQEPGLHVRALMYQGIVRYRMGIKDSTVYIPLKDAVAVGEAIDLEDKKALGLANYYLGVLHDKNENYDYANNYFNKALSYAKISRDTSLLFYNYSELAWNALKKEELTKAKLYIDTLQAYSHLSEYMLADTEGVAAVYYFSNKEYEKALALELKQLERIDNSNKMKLYKQYYKLYDVYNKLEDFKEAYRYLKLAIENMDEGQQLAYLAYFNLGNVAAELNLTNEASSAYQTAYKLQSEATDSRLNKQILELEKKYDYTEVEMQKLQVERRGYIITIVAAFVVLFLLSLLFVIMFRTAKQKNRLLIAENEKKELLANNKYLLLQEQQNSWTKELLLFIAQQSEAVAAMLYKIKVHSQFGKSKELIQIIENIEKEHSDKRKNIIKNLSSNELFYQLTDLSKEEAKNFNYNEKMLLTLLCANYSRDQIALMLYSSEDSIRVRTNSLKKKIKELGIKTEYLPS